MRLLFFILSLLCSVFAFSQTCVSCHLHINAGQSNAVLIEDDIEEVWDSTLRAMNCGYDIFHVAHIGDGGTYINQHINPNAGHPAAPIGNQNQGQFWIYNTDSIQNALNYLNAQGCNNIEVTMSWYQGEADANWANSTYTTTYNWYLDALGYLQNDYATLLGVSNLPLFIIEINSATGILNFENAVDDAGEDYTTANIDVAYYQIVNTGTPSAPVYQALNNNVGLVEDIYGTGQGVHAKDWFSEQYTIPALSTWVSGISGCTTTTVRCLRRISDP